MNERRYARDLELLRLRFAFRYNKAASYEYIHYHVETDEFDQTGIFTQEGTKIDDHIPFKVLDLPETLNEFRVMLILAQ